MSSEFNEDEFEEIEPEKTTVQKEEIIEEEEVTPVEVKKPDNLNEINRRRKLEKKINAIRFLTYFALNPDSSYKQIAADLRIKPETARTYLKDYANVVVNSINNKTYPQSVVSYYNEYSIPKDQRLNVGHVQDLKPVILRYNKVNIDSAIKELEVEDPYTKIANEIVGEGETEGTEEEEPGPYKQYNEYKRERQVVNTVTTINENSPISDVIEFGLQNSGQIDMGKIRRIKTMFSSSPIFYLNDEAKFTELFESNGIKEKELATFMNWFKNIAPIKPAERVGFLSFKNINMPTAGQQQKQFSKFNINEYDDYAQYLYNEGVYKYGLTPDNPINVESYNNWLEKKKQKEEEDKLQRQMSLLTKKMMFDMQARALGGNGMLMNGNQQQGIAFDERQLVERGVLLPEITYNENGQRITKLIPTGRPFNPMYEQQPQQRDTFTESINTFSRFIEAVKPMLQPNGGNQSQNPLMDKVMTLVFERLINKVEENPVKTVETQLSILNQMKTMFPQQEPRGLDKDAAAFELEKFKIQNDVLLANREIDIKEKHWQIEQQRMENEKHESKGNIEYMMDIIGKGFEWFKPILGQIVMGQIGGGLNSMGMPPMMGNPVPDMIQQQPPSPFIPQEDNSMNDFTPPPEFMPSPPQPQPQPQQFTPQEQYIPPQQFNPQPQPQQFIPQPEPQFYQYDNAVIPQQDNIIDTISPDELDSLTIEQINDLESRLKNKMSKYEKYEKMNNMLKNVKAKKRFGYNYHVLDVPKDIPSDYDGVEEEEEEPVKKVTKKTTTTTVIPTEFVFNDDFDNFNNEIIEIEDMTDQQQFNQQNAVNQKEFIEDQVAKAKDRERTERLAKLKAKGCSADINLNNVHLFDDNGNPINNDAAADPASPLNKDQYHYNNALDETNSIPSKEYQESQKNQQKSEKISDKERQANIEKEQEEIRKESGFGDNYKSVEVTEFKKKNGNNKK